MRKKYKITGFARLLIFLLFFTPIAYIGASYYNGEDGIAKIKALFNKYSGKDTESTLELKKAEISELEKKLEALKKDVERLENSEN